MQQSSNTTYRVYDYHRQEPDGTYRPLHIDKALDVTHTDFAPETIHWEEKPGITRVLEEPFFSLDLIRAAGEPVRLPEPEDFGFLTALDGGLTLAWETGEMPLEKGESFFLPRRGFQLTLEGRGRAALSMPRD